tara:strand:+ start:133 stop:351 length:219 start_codon:yes stop_codon:yes gene_type:complete
MKTIISIEDSTNEVYYINPQHLVYIKEKKNIGTMGRTSSWKISLVNGESIITKNEQGVKALISTFIKNKIGD